MTTLEQAKAAFKEGKIDKQALRIIKRYATKDPQAAKTVLNHELKMFSSNIIDICDATPTRTEFIEVTIPDKIFNLLPETLQDKINEYNKLKP